ncbi:MAG TPA: DUF3048 domain-containing protein [Candidatus Saccharimonadales bacterium]|nr:DUF3048 domain-containing protein [Candidatus Saccharimonadales bacterium]
MASLRKLHWIRFKYWVQTHKKQTIIISAVVGILVFGVGGYFGYKYFFTAKSKSEPAIHTAAVIPKKPPKPILSPLTGLPTTAALAARPVTAIMIENDPPARPQAGLSEAGLVFEAIDDGGITRYLALYQEAEPTNIGPVRSLRPYYLDWGATFDASIVHVGGSALALQEVTNGNYFNGDYLRYPQYFWRITQRVAPYNVFTDTSHLDELNAKLGLTHSNFAPFPRKPDAPAAVPTATNIQVNFSSYLYQVNYTYNKATNTYLRDLEGSPQIDSLDNQQLNPKVVVVIQVNESTVMEDGYRQVIDTTGSGQMWLFQDGIVTQGTWSKPSDSSQFVFTDTAGHVLKLNAGQVFIEAVPTYESISYTAS